jgi:hypothetical protein
MGVKGLFVIIPSVVQAEIAQPGSTGVRVILSEKGHLITVIPGGLWNLTLLNCLLYLTSF